MFASVYPMWHLHTRCECIVDAFCRSVDIVCVLGCKIVAMLYQSEMTISIDQCLQYSSNTHTLTLLSLISATLRALYLSDNDFEILPSDIGKLAKLQIVSNLSKFPLKSIAFVAVLCAVCVGFILRGVYSLSDVVRGDLEADLHPVLAWIGLNAGSQSHKTADNYNFKLKNNIQLFWFGVALKCVIITPMIFIIQVLVY